MMFFRGNKHVARRQREADLALAISQRVAVELDELEAEVLEKVQKLRRLNQENNFSAKMALLYSGAK